MPNQNGSVTKDRQPAVLFVDDEPQLRALAVEMLDTAGFQTFTAADGAEALELLKVNPDIGVMISDIRMPGMGGEELLTIAQARYPSLKVGLLTGFVEDASFLFGQDKWAIFVKPFDIERLPWLATEITERDRPIPETSAGSEGSCQPLCAKSGGDGRHDG